MAANNNVFQKLINSRKEFLDVGVSKSGKNIAMQFKYFELVDIVPEIIRIFQKNGLVSLVSFTTELATMKIVNCDNPEEVIEFTSPMKQLSAIITSSGKAVMNELQALGAVETYQRRYLYLMALDIVESDQIDGENVKPTLEVVKKEKKAEKPTTNTPPVTNVNPVVKATKTPPTVEERKEIKKEIVAEQEIADPLQVSALKRILKDLLAVDPEQEEFVQKIAQKTEKFTKLSKANAEILIQKCNMLLENLKKTKGQE